MTRAPFAVALAASLACQGAGGVPGEALHDPYTERLVVGPYPPKAPWPQVTDEHTREGTLAEWAPAGAPGDRLSQQVLFGRQATSPEQAARDEILRISTACGSVRTDGPNRASEDGNDVAYAEVACGDGSLVLVKVVRGHEALYVVRRRFGASPRAQGRREIDAWLADEVYLCPIAGGLGRCLRR